MRGEMRASRRGLGRASFVALLVILFQPLLGPSQVSVAAPGPAAATVPPSAMWSWGDNSSRSLAIPDSSQWVTTPSPAQGVGDLIQVAAGSVQTTVLKSDGTV